MEKKGKIMKIAKRIFINELNILLKNILISIIIFTFVATAFAKGEVAKQWKILSGYSKLVWDVNYSPKGNYFALTVWDNTIEIYDKNWKKLWTFQENLAFPGDLVFMPDEKNIILAKNRKDDSEISIVNLGSRHILQTIDGYSSHINKLKISPDGNYLAAAYTDNKIRIWKIIKDRLYKFKELSAHKADVYSIAFSNNGNYFASASGDKTIKIWKFSKGNFTPYQSLQNTDVVQDVAFSPNGKFLASGGNDKTVKIWEFQNKKFVHVQSLREHTDTIYNVVFSPDGSFLASASGDKTVRLWKQSGDSFKEIQILVNHDDTVFRIAFSPNGEYLSSAGGDKTVRIWKL
jgi:WD40 repeat protein